MKTKLRNICDKYNHIRVPYKFRKVVEQLSRNKGTMVLKQDKSRGVVVIDRKKYTENVLICFILIVLFDLTMIHQKRLKGKFKGPCVKSRAT